MILIRLAGARVRGRADARARAGARAGGLVGSSIGSVLYTAPSTMWVCCVCAVGLVCLIGGVNGADKTYGVNTGMKIHGNQGKEEDEPKVLAAAESIKCDVCTTLVEDLWNKTAGIDYDPGETGR